MAEVGLAAFFFGAATVFSRMTVSVCCDGFITKAAAKAMMMITAIPKSHLPGPPFLSGSIICCLAGCGLLGGLYRTGRGELIE